MNHFIAIIILVVIGVFPVVFSLGLIPGEVLLSASPSAAVTSPRLCLYRMPVSPPPGQLVLQFLSPSALKPQLYFTSHFRLHFYLKLKYVMTIILQENRGRGNIRQWNGEVVRREPGEFV